MTTTLMQYMQYVTVCSRCHQKLIVVPEHQISNSIMHFACCPAYSRARAQEQLKHTSIVEESGAYVPEMNHLSNFTVHYINDITKKSSSSWYEMSSSRKF